jgi:hypothetical protein
LDNGFTGSGVHDRTAQLPHRHGWHNAHLVGGRLRHYRRSGGLDGKVLPRRWNANANTDGNCDGYRYGYGNSHSNRNSHSHADGVTNTHAVRRKMYSDAAASSDSSASPVSARSRFAMRSASLGRL